MVINTNITAEISASLLGASSSNLAKSLQRLSSGSKLVSPEDDAAGLAVSMKFDAQSSRLGAAANNVHNAVSFVQTQDGYLQQVAKALNRMSQLAVSAEDSTKTDNDRTLYNAEFQQLASYISNISGADFNGVSLFSGSGNAVTIDSDANTFSMTGVNLGQAAYKGATGTNPGAGNNITISTTTAALTAITNIKAAINQLAVDRANAGANLARLNYSFEQLNVQKTNIDSANSALKDVDVANESTNYARMNILVQSGTAMLAQANTMPQSVLKLLG
jgi:flagellin